MQENIFQPPPYPLEVRTFYDEAVKKINEQVLTNEQIELLSDLNRVGLSILQV